MKVSISPKRAKDLEFVIDAWVEGQIHEGKTGYVKYRVDSDDNWVSYYEVPLELASFVEGMIPDAKIEK
ncbi:MULTISPECIES: hypothetical protein [Gluconobacter]|uniref:hypothetical protein n=1 Tax=Gluconobacter TaxID=441 RepID=UPI0039E91A43